MKHTNMILATLIFIFIGIVIGFYLGTRQSAAPFVARAQEAETATETPTLEISATFTTTLESVTTTPVFTATLTSEASATPRFNPVTATPNLPTETPTPAPTETPTVTPVPYPSPQQIDRAIELLAQDITQRAKFVQIIAFGGAEVKLFTFDSDLLGHCQFLYSDETGQIFPLGCAK